MKWANLIKDFLSLLNTNEHF